MVRPTRIGPATFRSGVIGAQEPLHPGNQIGLGLLDHQKVISHQAVSMDLPGGFLAGLREGVQKPQPILVIF